MKESVDRRRWGDRCGCCLILHGCSRFIHLRSSPARSAGGRGYQDNMLGCGVAQQVEPGKYDAALQQFGDSAANSDTNLKLGYCHFQIRPRRVKTGQHPPIGTDQKSRTFLNVADGARADLMSEMGHSRPSHSAPVPTNVRCYSKSDRILRRSEMTLCAISGLNAPQQTASLFDHLVGASKGADCRFL
jgi:hypothetical protein